VSSWSEIEDKELKSKAYNAYSYYMSLPVLLVDDDILILNLVSEVLKSAGYLVLTATNIKDAERLALRHHPSAAIVDINLGEESGLDLVRTWRVRKAFPVLVLSSKGQAMDRVIGLELGARDYLVKPFEPRELILRLKLVLNHENIQDRVATSGTKWQLGTEIFDPERRSLFFAEDEVELSTAEYNLLEYLVRHANKVVTRDQILNAVHNRDRMSNDRAVDVLVGRLRKKIKSKSISIQTIHGAGYMLSGTIEVLN
jgi:DNA-binding response OmpR family regulator